MVDKKTLSAGLDKAGQLITAAQKSGKKLASSTVREIKRTLGTAATELFRMKAQARKQSLALNQKRLAVKKSVGEKLISQADANVEIKRVITASTNNSISAKKIQASLEAVKQLSAAVNALAAAPELEILDKGHTTTDSIPKPENAKQAIKWSGEEQLERMKEKEKNDAKGTSTAARRAAIRARIARRKLAMEGTPDELTGDQNNTPELKSQEQGLRPQDSEPISQGRDERLEDGAPADNGSKGDVSGDALSEPMVTAKKRASMLLRRAASIVNLAGKERMPAKKAAMLRRASVLEKMADKLVASVPAAKPVVASTVKKLSAERLASIKAKLAARKTASADPKPVFAATERVLMADGSVGTVKSASTDKLIVTVAGVEKTVLSSTVKKISSAPQVSAPASAGILDRVSSAIAMVRGSKKVKAEAGDPEPASVPGSEMKPEPTSGNTVSKMEGSTVTFNPELNKWLVNVSATEVMEFPDEQAAKSFVAKAAKKQATTENPGAPTDSASTKESGAAEDTQKTLKGLDQSGKDYGTTGKDQKVNDQQGPVAHNAGRRIATAQNPGLPTDSTTAKESGAAENVVSKIKGLTQQNKGYSSTAKDQKMDPQFGPIQASKVRILEASNKRLLAELSVSSGKLLADRAVKVGAITEARRADQEVVLAELYQNSPAEFKAYARLVSDLETSASSTQTLASRSVRKVEASLAGHRNTVLDSSASSSASASLDNGNFFE